MGTARTVVAQKRHSKASASRTFSGSKSDSNIYHYESFPIIPSRSRSRSPIDGGQHEGVTTTSTTTAARYMSATYKQKGTTTEYCSPQVEDPGNPVGNAVDFCVNTITFQNSNIDVGSVFKPCHEKYLQQFLEDCFLLNTTAASRNQSMENANGTSTLVQTSETKNPKAKTNYSTMGDSRLPNASSKKSKNGWKSKAFLKPKGFKRKQQSMEDDDQSLWKGIVEDDLTVDDIITISVSDDDTLFTNLEPDDTWKTPEPLQEDVTIDISKVVDSEGENAFGDEGVGTRTAGEAPNTSFHMCFSPDSLCARQDGALNTDKVSETGDLVIPRDFENGKTVHGTSAKATNAPMASTLESYPSDEEDGEDEQIQEEEKIEFEMILEDSRFGNGKWSAITPWKKISSFFAIRDGLGKRRQRENRASSGYSGYTTANGESTEELELVLDDLSLSRNIIEPRPSRPTSESFRKRRSRSSLFGFSSRSGAKFNKTASLVSSNRRRSWKKMTFRSFPAWRRSRPSDNAFPSNGDQPCSYDKNSNNNNAAGDPASGELDKSEESVQYSETLLYSESDNDCSTTISKRSESKSIETLDQSTASVMGLEECTCGVFNTNQAGKNEEDFSNDGSRSDDLNALMLLESTDECDSATDYTAQDGETSIYDNDTTHDGWIMSEDQLASCSEDSQKSRQSNGSPSPCGSSLFLEKGGEYQETIDTQKLTPEKSFKKSKKKREGLRSFSKSIRNSFSAKKKNKGVTMETESRDDHANCTDGTPTPIETVTNKEGEDRCDRCVSTPVQQDPGSSKSGKSSSKAKKFWKQQSSITKPPRVQTRSYKNKSSSRRRWGVRRSSAETDPTFSSNDIVTVVTKTRTNTIGLERASTASTSATISSVPMKSQLYEYQPPQSKISLLDENPVKDDDDEEDDDDDYDYDSKSSAYDESTASASTNSRSWARDDSDTQSEDYFYGFDFFPFRQVLRE